MDGGRDAPIIRGEPQMEEPWEDEWLKFWCPCAAGKDAGEPSIHAAIGDAQPEPVSECGKAGTAAGNNAGEDSRPIIRGGDVCSTNGSELSTPQRVGAEAIPGGSCSTVRLPAGTIDISFGTTSKHSRIGD
eukprot:scaffold27874_cov29-Tisochrysis_lutea.AAC.1